MKVIWDLGDVEPRLGHRVYVPATGVQLILGSRTLALPGELAARMLCVTDLYSGQVIDIGNTEDAAVTYLNKNGCMPLCLLLPDAKED